MSKVEINDMNEDKNQEQAKAEDVKGGAGYIKFDGVDGESKYTEVEWTLATSKDKLGGLSQGNLLDKSTPY